MKLRSCHGSSSLSLLPLLPLYIILICLVILPFHSITSSNIIAIPHDPVKNFIAKTLNATKHNNGIPLHNIPYPITTDILSTATYPKNDIHDISINISDSPSLDVPENEILIEPSSLTDGEDMLMISGIMLFPSKNIHLTGDILRLFLRSPWVPSISKLSFEAHCGDVLCINQTIQYYKLKDDISLNFINLKPREIPIKATQILFFLRIHLLDAVLVNPLSLELFFQYQFVDRTTVDAHISVSRHWTETFSNVYWTTPCDQFDCANTIGFNLALENFTPPPRDEPHYKLSDELNDVFALMVELSSNAIFTSIPSELAEECTMNYFPIKIGKLSNAVDASSHIILIIEHPNLDLYSLQTLVINCPNVQITFNSDVKDYIMTFTSGVYYGGITPIFIKQSTYTEFWRYKPYRPQAYIQYKPGLYDYQGNTMITGFFRYPPGHSPHRYDKVLVCGLDEASILTFTIHQPVTNDHGKVYSTHVADNGKNPLTAYSVLDLFDPSFGWDELYSESQAKEREFKLMGEKSNFDIQSTPSNERVCVDIYPYRYFDKITGGYFWFVMGFQLASGTSPHPYSNTTDGFQDLFFQVLGSAMVSGVGLYNWQYQGPLRLITPPTDDLDKGNGQKLFNNIFFQELRYQPFNKTAANPNPSLLESFYKHYPFNVALPRMIFDFNLTKSNFPSSFPLSKLILNSNGYHTILPMQYAGQNYANYYNFPEASSKAMTQLNCNVLIRSFPAYPDLEAYIQQYPNNIPDNAQDTEYFIDVHTVFHKDTLLVIDLTTAKHIVSNFTRIIVDCKQQLRLVANSRISLNSTSIFGLLMYRALPTTNTNIENGEDIDIFEGIMDDMVQNVKIIENGRLSGSPINPLVDSPFYTFSTGITISNVEGSPNWSTAWPTPFLALGWTTWLIITIILLSLLLLGMLIFSLFRSSGKKNKNKAEQLAYVKLDDDVGSSDVNTSTKPPYGAINIDSAVLPAPQPPQTQSKSLVAQPLAAKKIKSNYGDFL